MKCASCETEINPKWKHAIDQNICPFCGQQILEQHLKNCITTLSSAMEEMQKYPDQLDDWLLSNHGYIKTSSPNLINYLPDEVLQQLTKKLPKKEAPAEEPKSSTIKIKLPGGGVQEVLVEKTQSEETTNSFFERAEVLKGAGKTSGKAPKEPGETEAPKSVAEKTQHLKKLAQQIRTEVSQGITEETDLAAMMHQEDPEAVAQLQSIIDSGDIISSSLPEPSTGDDDEIPSVVLNMVSRANKGSSDANEKDLRTLQEMQNKVSNAQKRLNSGKGGFSRA